LKNFPKKFLETIKKSSILLIIGLLRLIIVKGTNYNYAFTEYGLHWNFFFTIFFVRIFSCLLSIITRKSSLKSFLLSISIGIAYQILLSNDNEKFTAFLLDYHSYDRETLFEQNKEGN
jgi:glucosaminylphosphatidylinositol acyltransferase